jgi:hypothetical protein
VKGNFLSSDPAAFFKRQLRRATPMKIFFLLFLCLVCTHSFVFAQENTEDSTHIKHADSLTVMAKHRANKAAILSAVLPGAGQVYNKSYWKVPVLYAGFAALIYYIDFNQKYYKTFKTAYLYRTDLDSTTIDAYPNYTNDDLLVRKDYYRRNRDLCYILTGVVYVLNIIDAYVDAHLKDFDVGDDLSLHTEPYFNLAQNGTPVAGISLCLKIGR